MSGGFTPGPWSFVRTPYGRGAIREIHSPEDGFVCRITHQNSKTAHRADANANLIASSPELYEALDAIGYWPSVRAAIGDKLSAQLDAALAKARGEQVHSDPLPKEVGR